MAVFVCCSDESYDADNFFYSGWAAPVETWENDFTPAWNERVLKGPPPIPFLHMTEIREWDWQDEHGLKPWQADRRVDEAVSVIRSTGALVPVVFGLSRDDYDAILKKPFRRDLRHLEADHLCFQWFAFTQLQWLHERYGSEIERLDFWVEHNGRITRHMAHYHAQLVDGLRYIGREYLVPIVGDFREVGKECVHAQAADVLGWHSRNARRGKLDRRGHRRYWQLTEGGFGTRRGRFGHHGTMSQEDLGKLAERFAFRIAEDKAGGHDRAEQ
jgi:hypothetical protein